MRTRLYARARKLNLKALLFLILFPDAAVGFFPVDYSWPISRIAVGSCNHQDRAQPYWNTLGRSEIDLWIWLGDSIYADTEDMQIMADKYQAQFNHPDYSAFRVATPVVGTWDDHDYGENNSGKWYPKKAESKRLLLDFLEEPVGSPRRSRDGVYQAYSFGPPDKRVDLILLDNRFFAESPGPEADLLGERQWEFLREALEVSTAQFVFVASGTQVLAIDHRFEKWANFPGSRRRLLKTIRESGKGGVVLLSGDRHLHEISMVNDETVPYPLIDFTASGLTHSYSSLIAEKNRYRVGAFHNAPGFGVIEIDWDREDPLLTLQARDMKNEVRLRFQVSLSSLQPNKDPEE